MSHNERMKDLIGSSGHIDSVPALLRFLQDVADGKDPVATVDAKFLSELRPMLTLMDYRLRLAQDPGNLIKTPREATRADISSVRDQIEAFLDSEKSACIEERYISHQGSHGQYDGYDEITPYFPQSSYEYTKKEYPENLIKHHENERPEYPLDTLWEYTKTADKKAPFSHLPFIKSETVATALQEQADDTESSNHDQPPLEPSEANRAWRIANDQQD